MLLAEKWIEKIIDVKRANSRIMVIKILVGQTVLAVVSTNAPQQGLEDSVKNKVYDEVLATTSKFNARELVIIAGDLNRHVGKASDGYEGIHGGSGFGDRNTEGERILEFCDAKAIGKMKSGKATGPTGIAIDMRQASGDVCIDLVTELINDIIADGVIPQDWQVSSIINKYKGKGDAVERGNYRGSKLLDHIMKLLEMIIEQVM